jgi:hypothetical protein
MESVSPVPRNAEVDAVSGGEERAVAMEDGTSNDEEARGGGVIDGGHGGVTADDPSRSLKLSLEDGTARKDVGARNIERPETTVEALEVQTGLADSSPPGGAVVGLAASAETGSLVEAVSSPQTTDAVPIPLTTDDVSIPQWFGDLIHGDWRSVCLTSSAGIDTASAVAVESTADGPDGATGVATSLVDAERRSATLEDAVRIGREISSRIAAADDAGSVVGMAAEDGAGRAPSPDEVPSSARGAAQGELPGKGEEAVQVLSTPSVGCT